MSVDLDATRKLRTDAKQRLIKGLCERLPEIVEGMEFYQIRDGDFSAYEIVEVHNFRIILSVKTDEKKLRKAGG
jgi:hypothetical protein